MLCALLVCGTKCVFGAQRLEQANLFDYPVRSKTIENIDEAKEFLRTHFGDDCPEKRFCPSVYDAVAEMAPAFEQKCLEVFAEFKLPKKWLTAKGKVPLKMSDEKTDEGHAAEDGECPQTVTNKMLNPLLECPQTVKNKMTIDLAEKIRSYLHKYQISRLLKKVKKGSSKWRLIGDIQWIKLLTEMRNNEKYRRDHPYLFRGKTEHFIRMMTSKIHIVISTKEYTIEKLDEPYNKSPHTEDLRKWVLKSKRKMLNRLKGAELDKAFEALCVFTHWDPYKDNTKKLGTRELLEYLD